VHVFVPLAVSAHVASTPHVMRAVCPDVVTLSENGPQFVPVSHCAVHQTRFGGSPKRPGAHARLPPWQSGSAGLA
jgi:hypothetical protein